MTIVKLDQIRITRKPQDWDGDLMKIPAEDRQTESLLAAELEDGLYLTERGDYVRNEDEETTAVRVIPHSCTTVTAAEKETFRKAFDAWQKSVILTDLIARSEAQLYDCQGTLMGLSEEIAKARAPIPLEQFELSFEKSLTPDVRSLLHRGLYQVGSAGGKVPAAEGRIRVTRIVGTGKTKDTFPVLQKGGNYVLDRDAEDYQKALERNRCPLPISYPLTEELKLEGEDIQYVGVYYIPFKNRPMTHSLAEKTARDFCRA